MGEDVDFCWRMRGLEHISYQTGVFTGCLRLLSFGSYKVRLVRRWTATRYLSLRNYVETRIDPRGPHSVK